MTRLATCNNIPRFQALVNHYFHFLNFFQYRLFFLIRLDKVRFYQITNSFITHLRFLEKELVSIVFLFFLFNFCEYKKMPLRHLFYLIVGNNNTSRIDCASVNNITSRSIPIPNPPVGGKPYSKASMKSSSTPCASSFPCSRSFLVLQNVHVGQSDHLIL